MTVMVPQATVPAATPAGNFLMVTTAGATVVAADWAQPPTTRRPALADRDIGDGGGREVGDGVR